ncbi:T9SS type A sorting domain-containing protein [bacterium]|nr:T9SS type A sorting domain-containing protein [bacterium]
MIDNIEGWQKPNTDYSWRSRSQHSFDSLTQQLRSGWLPRDVQRDTCTEHRHKEKQMKKGTWLLTLVALLMVTSFGWAATQQQAKALYQSEQRGEQLTPAEKELLQDFEDQQAFEALRGFNGELDRVGGPDEFGYTFIDSDEEDGPDFDWIDITGSGDMWDTGGDDSGFGPVALGFTFGFYGTDYTEIYFSSNGYLTFSDEDQTDYSNDNIPSTTTPNNYIAPYWDDFTLGYDGSGPVYYESTTYGGENAFVVTYNNLIELGGTQNDSIDAVTMQVILLESGGILMQYDEFGSVIDRTSATVGIENADGTIGLAYGYNNTDEMPTNDMAILFSVEEPDATISGTISNGDGPVEGATVYAGGLMTTTGADGGYELEVFSGETMYMQAGAENHFTMVDYLEVVPGTNTWDATLLSFGEAPFQAMSSFEQNQWPLWPDLTNTPDSWEWGMNTSLPDSAADGDYVWAVNLDGNYLNSADAYLYTNQEYEITDADAMLSYWHFLNYESGFDGYHVLITTDQGETWTLLTPEGDYNDDSVTGLDDEPGWTGEENLWTEVSYPLVDYVGETVAFAFRHGTDSSVNDYSGVAIDGFSVDVDAPTVSIEEIQTNFEEYEGQTVWVSGIVTQAPNTTATGFTDMYIQDESGYGIQLYSSDLMEDFARGDELLVSGVVDEFNDVTEIVDWEETYDILSSGNDLPAPLTGTTMELSEMQDMEGTWTMVDGYVQNSPSAGGSGLTIWLSDGSGDVQVRIWNSTGIEYEDLERWDHVQAYGVIDLYQGDVQIQPSEVEDFEYAGNAGGNLDAPSNLAATLDEENYTVELTWDGVEELDETFRHYGVYRDNVLVGVVPTGESYTDMLVDFGELSYTVNAYYDVGVSAFTEEVLVDVAHPLWMPMNAMADIDQETGAVDLSWEPGGTFGEDVELLQEDSNTPVGSYIWPGNTMAMQLTTEGEAHLLGLVFLTTLDNSGPQAFNAELYDYDEGEGEPLADPFWSSEVQAADGSFLYVDVSDEDVMVDGSFVVGFGSIDGSAAIAYEEAVEGFEYAWDRVGGTWGVSTTEEPYVIRAVVQYTDGTMQLTGPHTTGRPAEMPAPSIERTSIEFESATGELDDLVEYVIYRDTDEIARTDATTYMDQLDEFGTYEYTFQAVYDEGTSDMTDPLSVEYTGMGVGEGDNLPTEFAIEGTYPNPFNPTVNIRIAVPELSKVQVAVYDVLGREVAVLNQQQLRAGYHTLQWRATGTSGVYFLRVQAENGWSDIRKLIYMK